MKLWEGRFEKENSPVMKRMNNSLEIDIRLLPYDIELNRAWAGALERIGILTKDELKNIQEGLEIILKEYREGRYAKLPEDEDVHTLVERRLTELIGPAGQKVHTGRSRNEQIVTDTMLYLRRAVPEAGDRIKDLIKTIVMLSEENIEVVMPGYTHLQQAQPILLSHYLLSLAWMLKEDSKELEHLINEVLSSCPLGSGAIGGTAFPIDRETLAKSLGFKTASPNSIQSVSNRDFVLKTTFVLANIMIHLSRYAEDFIIWSTPEFGFIELDESVSTGSSMMPQKKNPDSLELIRGKSARVIGNHQTLLTLIKGLPLTYAKDLQEDKRPLFDSIDETLGSLELFGEVLKTITFNRENMASKIQDFTAATDLADFLTKKGIPFREAHAVVGRIILKAKKEKRSLKSFSLEELKTFSDKFAEDALKLLEPKNSVLMRNITGGTGPKSVREQIEKLKL